jgi:nicotinate-nucleotide pyrophosphorylase (carboxylating)
VFAVPDSSDIVALALAEDFGVEPKRFSLSAPGDPKLLARDVTSFSAIGLDAQFCGRIVARQVCTVAGLPLVAAVYDRLSAAAGLVDPVEVFPLVAEGTRVSAGTPVAEVDGIAAAVLAGERTALDFLMQLSGIATTTAVWVKAAQGRFAVCDTRKTPPGLRALAKYAVGVGGGVNHRTGLHDMALIKDNHISRAGGITAAVGKVRTAWPSLLIEVEADSVPQAIEAVSAGAEMVLLDNFDDVALSAAVKAVRDAAEKTGRSVLIEASGGITLARVPSLRRSGVDRVSTSALTFGARVIDFGLDEIVSGGGGA